MLSDSRPPELERMRIAAFDWWRSWRRFCGVFQAKNFEGVLVLPWGRQACRPSLCCCPSFRSRGCRTASGLKACMPHVRQAALMFDFVYARCYVCEWKLKNCSSVMPIQVSQVYLCAVTPYALLRSENRPTLSGCKRWVVWPDTIRG